jgi:hypothetical protein
VSTKPACEAHDVRKIHAEQSTGATGMATSLKKGDHVSWDTSQGETHGIVEAKVTSTTKIKGHTAKATKDNPQYKVKSEKTGAEAVHKAASLHKKG